MVYAYRNPCVYVEKWLVMIGRIETNECYLRKLVKSQERVVEVKFDKIPMTSSGEIKFDIFVLPMAYLGMNQEINLSFNVIARTQIERENEYHEDDLNLEKNKSWFQQQLEGF